MQAFLVIDITVLQSITLCQWDLEQIFLQLPALVTNVLLFPVAGGIFSAVEMKACGLIVSLLS